MTITNTPAVRTLLDAIKRVHADGLAVEIKEHQQGATVLLWEYGHPSCNSTVQLPRAPIAPTVDTPAVDTKAETVRIEKPKLPNRLVWLLLLGVFGLTGCNNPFRDGPVIMYRDGWGGTNVVVPDPWQPIPYGASMPAHNGGNPYPDQVSTGWYLGNDNQWRPQRWVRLGTDQNGNPSYMAVYP